MAESGVVLNAIQNSYDSDHKSFNCISHIESRIFEGRCYTARRDTTSLAASSWVDLVLVTPTTATAEIHLYYNVNHSGGLVKIKLMEATTGGSTNGMPTIGVTPYNRNRGSANTAELSVYNDSTGSIMSSTVTSTEITFLVDDYVGSTNWNAVKYLENDDWILKAATTYILRVMNYGNAGACTLIAGWGEHC